MSDLSTAAIPRPDTHPSVHEAILAWFPPGGAARILDAGAGEGALSDALCRRGYQVVACEISPSRFRASGVPCIRADLNARLHFLLLGTCDSFDTLSGSRETAFHGTRGHINPVGYPELRYLVTRAGLPITDVTTNRDIRVALRDTTGWARWVRPALAVVASAARLATRLTRRTDHVALQLLSPALLYGENLIVRGARPSREDGEHA